MTSEILEYNDPEDSFVITGLGRCCSSSRWRLPEGVWEPWDLTGRICKMDGVLYKIKGVDAFAINRSPSNPYRHSFALCLEPL